MPPDKSASNQNARPASRHADSALDHQLTSANRCPCCGLPAVDLHNLQPASDLRLLGWRDRSGAPPTTIGCERIDAPMSCQGSVRGCAIERLRAGVGAEAVQEAQSCPQLAAQLSPPARTDHARARRIAREHQGDDRRFGPRYTGDCSLGPEVSHESMALVEYRRLLDMKPQPPRDSGCRRDRSRSIVVL